VAYGFAEPRSTGARDPIPRRLRGDAYHRGGPARTATISAEGMPRLLAFQTIQERREASLWTRVHPIFAIGQLGVFLVSVGLLVLYALHMMPFTTVYLSVLLKIACMVGAIVTGSLWEHDVFGPWWFADEFFIEDVMTVNVFLLHIGVIVAYFVQPTDMRLVLALLVFAYIVYGLNVAQYIVQHMRSEAAGSPGGTTKRNVAA
jgi:3-vinyl bacteriochlorophyllide hydratase